MKFTDKLWSGIQPVFTAMLELPFIMELTEGTLPEEILLFYLKQDTLYLADFSRALALAGIHSGHTKHMYDFLGFASGVTVVEQHLHQHFFERYGTEINPEKTPSCFAYTHFLLSTAATQSNAVNIAALLPCFWIYREVGMEIYKNATPENPYRDWIDTYAGEEFNKSVNRAIEITDEVAAGASEKEQVEMTRAFTKSTQLEWMFWDSAYRYEQWPLQNMIENKVKR